MLIHPLIKILQNRSVWSTYISNVLCQPCLTHNTNRIKIEVDIIPAQSLTLLLLLLLTKALYWNEILCNGETNGTITRSSLCKSGVVVVQLLCGVGMGDR